jgi:hypothetical protein
MVWDDADSGLGSEGRCPYRGKDESRERRMRTPVSPLRTADIRASEAFRAYAGHIDQTGIGQTEHGEHGSRWTA